MRQPVVCARRKPREKIRKMKDFIHPNTEFYPVPWWAWNGRLEFDEMRRQLDLMRGQGVYEFFIFALQGLEHPDFLSEEWFKYVEFTLDEAEKRGMKVWIYDELNWPSGSAGGYVVRDFPEKREFVFRMSDNALKPGEFVPVDPENLVLLKQRLADGSFKDAGIDEYGYFTNKSDAPCHLYGVRITPSSRPLTNVMGVTASWQQRGALDMLDTDSFNLWVQYIYNEYEKRFSARFGKVLKGFFTDEPQTHDYDGPTVPYTAKLVGRFIEKHGYDPTPHLLELFLKISGAEKFRRDYSEIVAEMFSANMEMVNNWCRERGLLFTGHCIWEEIGPNMQSFALRNGDPHRLLEKFIYPGCDLLGHTTPFLKNEPSLHRCWAAFGYPSTIYTSRYVSSTARWSGSKRCMCEAFGVRNPHSGMAGQKLINDFLAATGISLINDNTLVYTMVHSPGSKHVSQPNWRLYHNFTECSARLSWFAAWGRMDAHAAVMVPISTIWSRVRVMDWTNEEFKPWSDAFIKTSEQLFRHHIDFEYVFEDAPTTAEDFAQFSTIYMPKLECLPAETAARLVEFRKNGGRLIAIENAPEVLDGSGVLDVDAVLENAERIPESLPETNYSLEGEGVLDIVSALRVNGDERLLLIGNQTSGVKRITLKHRLGAVTEIMDPEHGGIYRLQMPEDGWSFALDEAQSIIVRMAPNASPEARDIREWKMLPADNEKTALTLSGNWAFDFGGVNFFKPALEIRFDPKNVGVDDNWPNNPPAEWYKVVNDYFPFNVRRDECEHYWVRGTFEIRDRVPENLSLFFGNDLVDNVFVNGRECNEWICEQLWDQNNRRCLIADAAVLGANTFYVLYRVSIMNEDRMKLGAQRDKVMLTLLYGDFALASDNALIKPPAEIALGSWKKNGFTYLPTYGTYSKKFQWNGNTDGAVLVIDDAKATVEVALNGIDLPARCWKPFRFDLSGALRQGENDLQIKVGASIGNVFWPSAFSSKPTCVDYGILGNVEIRKYGKNC